MNKLYRIISKDYITKILSEQNISIDYVDLESIQNLDDFIEFTKPTIRYSADDFLFSLSKENVQILESEKSIILSNTKQFGWYYSKIHKSEIQLYSVTNPRKFNKLKDLNPELIIDSFDKYRNFYRPIKATNVLNGAFGLAYTVFKDDYDNFFRKINIKKDKWYIEYSSIKPEDYAIIMQIFLYHNHKTKALKETLFKDNSKKAYRIFIFFLEECLMYFLKNDYSMGNFLEYMAKEFSKYDEIKPIADEFIKLNNLYVKKGLPVDTKFPPTTRTKEFLDLAKTESEYLKELLESNKLDKTAVFLLGMLNLGDRLDEQFSFDYFIPAIVDLTMRHIVDIQISEKELVISFDQKEINRNRNNKFEYVKCYFKELHTLNEILNEVNDLSTKSTLFKKIYESRTGIKILQADVKELSSNMESLDLQKDGLIDQIKKKEWVVSNYGKWMNSEDEKIELKKNIENLNIDISNLNDQYKDRQEEEITLVKDLDSLKANQEKLKIEIDTLKQNNKTLKLNKYDLDKENKSLVVAPPNKLKKELATKISEPKKVKIAPKVKKIIELQFPKNEKPSPNSPDSNN